MIKEWKIGRGTLRLVTGRDYREQRRKQWLAENTIQCSNCGELFHWLSYGPPQMTEKGIRCVMCERRP